MNDEGTRNDALRAELRRVSAEPPVDAVDWSGLHARIMAAAAPALADAASSMPVLAGASSSAGGPAVPATWWQFTADRAFRGGPLVAGAAAVVALLFVVVTGVDRAVPDSGGESAFRTVEEELYYGLSDAARPLLLAGAEAGVLLDAALFQGEE
jgi:hypothetical protein